MHINLPTKPTAVAANLTRRQNNYFEINLHSSPPVVVAITNTPKNVVCGTHFDEI